MTQTSEMEIGRLRRIRQGQRISLGEAAARAGMSDAALSRIERKPATVEQARKVLKAYGAADAMLKANPIIEFAKSAEGDRRTFILGLAFLDAAMEGIPADAVELSKILFSGRRNAEWVAEQIEYMVGHGVLTKKPSGLRINFNVNPSAS